MSPKGLGDEVSGRLSQQADRRQRESRRATKAHGTGHVKMRHCSSVVDVDVRRSFEGPFFSESAWSTVH